MKKYPKFIPNKKVIGALAQFRFHFEIKHLASVKKGSINTGISYQQSYENAEEEEECF